MKNRQVIKTMLCMILALVMTLAPVFSSYAEYDAESAGEGQVTAEQAEKSGPANNPDAKAESEEETSDSQTAADPDDASKEEQAIRSEEQNEQLQPDAAGGSEDAAHEEGMDEPSRTVYEWKDSKVKVSAVLSDAKAVPDDAKLVVRQIRKGSGSYNYNAYMKALNSRGDAKYTDDNTMLFDIAFIKDGEEIEPQSGTVSVKFEFLDSQLKETLGADDSSDVSVIHLPLKDSVRDDFDTTADAKKISAGDIRVEQLTASSNGLKVNVKNEEVEFATSSFSAFAYTVKISSADEAPANDDLSNFVTSASIEATKEDGKYVIKPGSKYSVCLTFAEKPELQFPDEPNAEMYYKLPDGLTAADGYTGSFVITINDGGTNYKVTDNRFKVDGNKIIVTFNSEDPDFEHLTAAANATFNIAFDGEFDGEYTEIVFDDEVEVDLDIDETHHVSASKSGTVDTANDRINYTIVLSSEGRNTNIKLEDQLIDSVEDLLVMDWGSLSVRSNKTDTVDYSEYAVPGRYNLTIPSMVDGERITIQYTVKIDPTKIQKGSDGKVITVGKNKLTVSSDNDPKTETKTAENTINYTPGINKSGRTIGSNNDTIEWTVTANPAAKVSIAGYNIKDTIAANSRQYIKYSGDGIHIKVQDNQNNTKAEYDVAWDQITEANTKDYTWTYTVPDTDTEPYKYIITYITKADNSDLHKDVTVNNTANIDGGGSKDSSGKIGPLSGDDYLRLTKSATDVYLDPKTGEGTISWHVKMEVPQGGLDNAEIVDKYPNTTINGQKLYEPVDEKSIKVEDQLEDEQYDVVIDDTQAKITFFYYENGTKKTGLKPSPTGKKRYINITFDTKINKTWLDNSGLDFSVDTHTNSVSINGGTGGSYAVIVQKPAINKESKPDATRTEGGTELPVYRYEVELTHVEGDGVVTVLDRYDKDLLEPYEPDGSADAWYVFGVNSKGSVKGGKFEHDETADGMRFTVNKSDLPKDNTYNGFYPKYKLVYYLTVKDEAAFKKIINGAIKDEEGKYTINNTAEWDGKTDPGNVDYEYPGLSKELLTSQDDLKKTGEDVWAEFKVTANPSAQTVNGGKTIKMTDTAENLDIDITSVKINGKDQWPGVSYDLDGKTMTYWIPDATKIVITYKARVNFPTDGKLQFNNKVQMLSYSDDVEKTAERNRSAGGVASVPAINLLKHEAGDISKTLAGAEFILLDENKAPVKDKDGNDVTYVTGDDGIVKVRGDMAQLGWALIEGKTYYLRETKAPKGFMLPGNDFQFTISKDGHSDHTQYIYHSGDTMSAKNYPVTDVDVEKVWSDGNNRHEADTVKVKLQQKIGEGSWSDTIRMEDENSESGWNDFSEGLTAELNKDNNWKYSFKDLPLIVPTGEAYDEADEDVDYRIVETEVNGGAPDEATVTVTRGQGDSKYQFTVNNNANICELKVVKKWKGADPDKLSASKKAKLKFTVTRDDGEVVAEFTYADMTNGAMLITDLAEGEYTVKETGADKLDIKGKRYDSTTYSVESGKTTVVKGSVANVTITNKYTPGPEIDTGDDGHIFGYLVLMIAAMLMLILTYKVKRRARQ